MSAARRFLSVTAVAVCAAAVGLLAVSAAVGAATAQALGSAPSVVEESSLDVSSTSATLAAEINSGGAATVYRFEYGTSDAYGSSIPVAGGEIAASTSAAAVQAHPQGLQPDTTYHYRVVATNANGTVEGEDQTFTTQTTGSELTLLDGRQWELVSPPNKHGAGIEAQSKEGAVIEASTDGGAITYVATGPVTSEPTGNAAPSLDQILSRRTIDGWQTQDIATSNETPAKPIVGNSTEYLFFSSDLSSGLARPFGVTPLSPETTEPTPYLRNDATGDYQPLVTAANVSSGTTFGGNVNFVDGTPDLSHLVLGSRVPLTENSEGKGGLYEWGDGRLQPIDVLPGAGGRATQSFLGERNGDVRNAISADGSRVVWSESSETTRTTPLYLRDTLKEETIQLDEVQGGSGTGAGEPKFQIANDAGSRIFFTDPQSLTANAIDAGYESGSLYECEIVEIAGQLKCNLTDLTVTEGEENPEVGGVVGASEDGSYVYFVSGSALARGATPEACNTCNLYVHHDGGTTFIASLSGGDVKAGGNPMYLSARVSPNGEWLAFMSGRSLTGYDNRDALSGEPDEEVYLYDVATGRLLCASCNPTGARPHGIFDPNSYTFVVDQSKVWASRWLAASLPDWTTVGLNASLYQDRYLSNSGRLFFNSPEALVPQDVNGVEDVYEYEPAGVGGCHQSGGCIGLISSGLSSEESAFLDASESGDDAFFLTAAELVPQDYDNAYDVYDAHVCSASVPCVSAPVSPPECTTADSCRAAVSPQPAIYGAPASATFSGAGNVTQPPVATPAAKRGKGKPKARKTHRRIRRKKRSAARGRRAATKGSRGAISSRARRATGKRGVQG